MPYSTDRLSSPETLRVVGLYSGIALALAFFLPLGESGSELVMSWDLAARSSKLAFLMVFPVVAGLGLVVMSSLPTLPHGARAVVTGLAGGIPLLVFIVLARDLVRAMGGTIPSSSLFYLGMLAVMPGLFLRLMRPGSTAARVLVCAGMLLLLLYYLIPRAIPGQTEKVMVLVAIFKAISGGEAQQTVMAILQLLPFLGAFLAALALPQSSGNPAVERGVTALAWGFLAYIPFVLLVVTSMALAEDAGLKVLGLASGTISWACYLSLYTAGASHALLSLAGMSFNLAAAPDPAGRYCPGCGAAVPPGGLFCEGCGHQLKGAGMAAKTRVEHKGLLIGRGETCDYELPDTMIGASREHARIEVDGQAAVLVDLGSANGTYVNGKEIRRAPLKPGDRVRFGKEAPEMPADILLQRAGLL